MCSCGCVRECSCVTHAVRRLEPTIFPMRFLRMHVSKTRRLLHFFFHFASQRFTVDRICSRFPSSRRVTLLLCRLLVQSARRSSSARPLGRTGVCGAFTRGCVLAALPCNHTMTHRVVVAFSRSSVQMDGLRFAVRRSCAQSPHRLLYVITTSIFRRVIMYRLSTMPVFSYVSTVVL